MVKKKLSIRILDQKIRVNSEDPLKILPSFRNASHNWDEVFNGGLSKFCRRQSLKNLLNYTLEYFFPFVASEFDSLVDSRVIISLNGNNHCVKNLESPETMRKLFLSTKFPNQKIR